jgi:hypothetical protein
VHRISNPIGRGFEFFRAHHSPFKGSTESLRRTLEAAFMAHRDKLATTMILIAASFHLLGYFDQEIWVEVKPMRLFRKPKTEVQSLGDVLTEWTVAPSGT